MPSKFEFEQWEKRLPWMYFGLGGLIIAECVAVARITPDHPYIATVAAIVPNFIAAIVGVLVSRYIFEKSKTTRYLESMSRVRLALRQVRIQENLRPDLVQTIVREFVSAASELYFERPRPPQIGPSANLTDKQEECKTCGTSCDMKRGACVLCGDTYDLWRVTIPASQSKTMAE